MRLLLHQRAAPHEEAAEAAADPPLRDADRAPPYRVGARGSARGPSNKRGLKRVPTVRTGYPCVMDLRARIVSLEQELQTAAGDDVKRVRLHLGDAHRALAAEHYLAAVERMTPIQALAIVRECVLLVPASRDLRRTLAEKYLDAGLVGDAQAQLITLLEQCQHAGIADEIEDAHRRLAALPPAKS